MEFSIDIFQSFAVKGENVLSVSSRSKFLLAAKVRIQDYLFIIFESKIIFIILKSYCLSVLRVQSSDRLYYEGIFSVIFESKIKCKQCC